MSYEALWTRYFAMTTLTEMAVALPLLHRMRADPSHARRVISVILGNLASHPLVWFVLARVLTPRSTVTLVAEPWAVLCEAVVYALVLRDISPSRALAVSALANAASFALGIAVNHWRLLG